MGDIGEKFLPPLFHLRLFLYIPLQLIVSSHKLRVSFFQIFRHAVEVCAKLAYFIASSPCIADSEIQIRHPLRQLRQLI